MAAWLKGMHVDVDAQRSHSQAQKIQFEGQMYAAGLRLDYSYPLSQKMQIQPYLDASFQHYAHTDHTQHDGVNALDDFGIAALEFGRGVRQLSVQPNLAIARQLVLQPADSGKSVFRYPLCRYSGKTEV